MMGQPPALEARHFLTLPQVFPTTPSLTTPSSMFASNAPKWQKQRPELRESVPKNSPELQCPLQEFFQEMMSDSSTVQPGAKRRDRGGGLGVGAGLRPDLITYSTLLKGYCQARGSLSAPLRCRRDIRKQRAAL